MKPPHWFWAMVALVSLAPQARASLPPRTEQAVVRYLAELKQVETSSERTSIEAIFAIADTLEQYLCNGLPLTEWIPGSKASPATIEDLTDDEFETLSQRLRGLLLNRDEVVFAEPDSGFYLSLARTKGLETDQAFMEMYFKTMPVAAWPAYVEQVTDYSGCDVYGTGVLVSLYEGWRQFRTRYPRQYKLPAQEQLDDIRGSLTSVNCACGGPDTVVRELELFLRRLPHDEIAVRIREELKELKEGRSDVRFYCRPG